MRRAILLLACMAIPVAAPVAAKSAAPAPVCPERVAPELFLSPVGEPFRPKGDDDDPVRRWFDQADRNHDATLTAGEMMLDADRFFAMLDKDGNGELLPEEVQAYERDIAPEIRLYQTRPPYDPAAKPDRAGDRPPPKARVGGRGAAAGLGGAMGAGRYAFLNIPNPVASADDDINRAVSAKEFRAAAAERFRDLDPAQSKALTLAQLPRTPAQVAANAACLARIKDAKEHRR